MPTATVASVQVNDGSVQRSEVRSITVTFSDQVSFAGTDPAAAFTLRQAASGIDVGLSTTLSMNGQGQTVATLMFSGAGTDPVSAQNGGAPSLADGQYTLTIFSSVVSDQSGPLDGAGAIGTNYVSPADLPGGGPGELGLFRLFGDTDGDGIVDQVDLGQFRSTFNASVGNPAYLPYLDADNSGSVDQVDLGQFRSRFNANVFSVAPPTDFYVNPATGNDANNGLTPTTAWKTWAKLVAAVADGTITGGAWVTSTGGAADISTIPTNADKTAWYAAYLAGQMQVTGAHIFIDTSEAPLQVTSLLVLPPGCEIESATDSLTNLEVNVPIPATEAWAQPDAADDPNVWGTTSTTNYHWTGLYEQMDGQWAQLYPIGAVTVANTLAEALPQLQATPGSFWVDPATNELYTHAIASGDPNTDGVARQYVPEWAETDSNARVVEVTGGIALRIGGDGGFGFDPTTGEANGINGIGSGEWNSISIIDSCQWSRAGKHTFSAVGSNQIAIGFVVFRDDTAEEGPGGVFVGYWSHFADYSGFSGVGSMMSIYDGDVTVNGWANVDKPGGSDADPTYLAFIAHTDDLTPAFSERLIENCDFAGTVSIGGAETVLAIMQDTTVAGDFFTATADTAINQCRLGYRMPTFDGITATVTDTIFTPGSLYTSGPGDAQGTVTLNRCTLDFTHGNIYSTAWTRSGALQFSITNSVILNFDNYGYGLVDGILNGKVDNVIYSDSLTIDHSLIQGPTGYVMVRDYSDATDESYADGLLGVPGLAVTNTQFVANAKLNPTTYAPLPGSLAVGQAVTVANAPDFTGTIWAVRHTAGAIETLNAPGVWTTADLPNLVDVWDALPSGAYQDAGETTPATADGAQVGGLVGQVNHVELTQSGAARPVLTTVGGTRGLAFNGSSSFNNITVPTDGGLTMAFVVSFPALGTVQTLYADSTNTHDAFIDAFGRIEIDGGAVQSSRSFSGGTHTVVIRETAGYTEIWIDGAFDTSANTGTAMPATMSLSLFNANGSAGYQGTLFGMAVVGEWISDTDVAGLDATFAAAP